MTGEVAAHFGQIDVAEFSPGGGNLGEGIVSVVDVDPDNLRLILDRFLISAVALVRAVLPAMIARGEGAILFTAGQSGVHPTARMGNVGMAQAALRNYFLSLNSELADSGVYVGAVNIGALIEGSVPHQYVASIAGYLRRTLLGPICQAGQARSAGRQLRELTINWGSAAKTAPFRTPTGDKSTVMGATKAFRPNDL